MNRIVSLSLVSLLLINGIASVYAQQPSILLSPLKQIKLGIIPQDVKCKVDLVLIIKKENGLPACVRPDTVIKLVIRGWSDSSYKHLAIVGSVNASSLPKSVPNNTKSAGLPGVGGGNLRPCPSGQYFDNGACRNISYSPITNATGSTIQLSPGISTPTISSTKAGIKILSIEMSPDPLKVGYMPIFTIVYQNISDKPFYVSGGCTTSSSSYTISPPDYVQEEPPGAVACDNYFEVVDQNKTTATISRSDHLNGFYKVIKPGILNVTMNIYVTDTVHGWDLIDTVQFNVNATQ